jgi:hypothetical protein
LEKNKILLVLRQKDEGEDEEIQRREEGSSDENAMRWE